MSPDTEKPATPTFARLQEQVAAEKALSGKADEKRELHGDGEYVEPGATNAVSKAQALDNPLSGISLDRLEGASRFRARPAPSFKYSC